MLTNVRVTTRILRILQNPELSGILMTCQALIFTRFTRALRAALAAHADVASAARRTSAPTSPAQHRAPLRPFASRGRAARVASTQWYRDLSGRAHRAGQSAHEQDTPPLDWPRPDRSAGRQCRPAQSCSACHIASMYKRSQHTHEHW